MNHKLLLATLGLGMMLGGCASMNKDECLTANWRDIGHEDGMKGASRNHIGDHRKACSEYGVTPDSNAYFQGYEEGVRVFCAPSNGLTVGMKGQSYNAQSCPADMEPAFLTQYNYGRQIFVVRNNLAQAKKDISDKEAQLERENDSRTRSDLRHDISSLDRDVRDLEAQEARLLANPPR